MSVYKHNPTLRRRQVRCLRIRRRHITAKRTFWRQSDPARERKTPAPAPGFPGSSSTTAGTRHSRGTRTVTNARIGSTSVHWPCSEASNPIIVAAQSMAPKTAFMCENHGKCWHKFSWACLTPANAAIPHLAAMTRLFYFREVKDEEPVPGFEIAELQHKIRFGRNCACLSQNFDFAQLYVFNTELATNVR